MFGEAEGLRRETAQLRKENLKLVSECRVLREKLKCVDASFGLCEAKMAMLAEHAMHSEFKLNKLIGETSYSARQLAPLFERFGLTITAEEAKAVVAELGDKDVVSGVALLSQIELLTLTFDEKTRQIGRLVSLLGVADAEDLWKMFDMNRDEFISRSEFQTGVRNFGAEVTAEEINSLFGAADRLTRVEFRALFELDRQRKNKLARPTTELQKQIVHCLNNQSFLSRMPEVMEVSNFVSLVQQETRL